MKLGKLNITMISELMQLREELLSASKGPDGFIDEQLVLTESLDLMFDAKLVDSQEFNDTFFKTNDPNIKLNGYAINESQERLQVFLVAEDFMKEGIDQEDSLIYEKSVYDKQFKRAIRFVKNSLNGTQVDQIQYADPARALSVFLSTDEGIFNTDVIEIFLITLSASVSRRGSELQPRDVYFPDQKLAVKQKIASQIKEKEIILMQRVIDLNFLHSVIESRGQRQPLEIDFERDFGEKLEVLQAAQEKNFESYLGVINADLIFNLYRKYSSRLLEKNVRSFLQFTNDTNKGMKKTIREHPEKFIAYNNGLTITATKVQTSSHKKKLYIDTLTDFQIVNGGQTTASIYFSKKEGIDVSQIRVMAKINVVKSENEKELDELISSVSKFSNTQSRVSPVDLRSRNPQLQEIKKLSESVATPSGRKWFFERAKGDFRTKLRMAGPQRKALEKRFPTSNRFTKEQLAKYYTAWGDQPYLVKKGGEKVFRDFIEAISPESDGGETIEINRTFYEELISKIILFRAMEKIYGQRQNAIGQIRAAAVPYAISCIFINFDGKPDGPKFNLLRIWKNEKLEDDLTIYLKNLLILMNDLIKKYSLSDDLGEYSKKPELWKAISGSPELREFLDSNDSRAIFRKYNSKKSN